MAVLEACILRISLVIYEVSNNNNNFIYSLDSEVKLRSVAFTGSAVSC